MISAMFREATGLIMRKLKLSNLIFLIASSVSVSLIVIVIILFSYSVHLNRLLSQQSIEIFLENIASSINSAVYAVKKQAVSLSQTTDFLIFCNTSKKDKAAMRADAIREESQKTLMTYAEVVGVFLYNAQCDYYYPVYKHYETVRVSQDAFPALMYDTEDTSDRFLRNQTVNGHTYLYYGIRDRYGLLLVLIDPSKNLMLANHNALTDVVKYTISTLPPQADSSKTIISRPLDNLGLHLAFEGDRLYHYTSMQILLLAVLIFLILLIPLTLVRLKQLIMKPLNEISRSLDIISDGDLDHRLQKPNTLDEISKFAENINYMLDKIYEYKEEGFNQRMDAVQAKLQYLQLQIHPHFYLNCMKSLNSYLYLLDYKNAQTLVMTLSDYISHTFRNVHNFISIKEELESVRSYIDLCNLLSYSVRLDFRLDGSCLSMNCLPMTILTFVENSVKYSTTPDNIEITIQVEIIETTCSSHEMIITVKNSGSQFPEKTLREMEMIDASQMVYRTKHIGITNVRYRLWLVYGCSASLLLRNEADCAVVEITIPCEPTTERTLL